MVPCVLVLIIFSIISDASTANTGTRTGKPLQINDDEEQKYIVPAENSQQQQPIPEALKLLAEKIDELTEKGQDITLQDLPPVLRDLVEDVETLCHIEKSGKNSRESRVLLNKLSFLTGLHLGSLFYGTGSISATQSLNVLGRIIRSALSISYGPQGSVPGIPNVPVYDEVLQDEPAKTNETNSRNRQQLENFYLDHNKRVGEINKQPELTTLRNFRQGRVK